MQFSQLVLIQTIQFSMSIVFVYTKLNISFLQWAKVSKTILRMETHRLPREQKSLNAAICKKVSWWQSYGTWKLLSLFIFSLKIERVLPVANILDKICLVYWMVLVYIYIYIYNDQHLFQATGHVDLYYQSIWLMWLHVACRYF